MKIPHSPREIITYFLHLVLGLVFVYAGVQKLWDIGPISFTDDIRSFHLIEDPWPAMVAISLPWLEILAGLAVILGPGRRGGLLIIVVSLVVFLVAIAQALARGINISCGCFGHSDRATTPWELILRDLILLGVGIYLLWPARKSRMVAPE